MRRIGATFTYVELSIVMGTLPCSTRDSRFWQTPSDTGRSLFQIAWVIWA